MPRPGPRNASRRPRSSFHRGISNDDTDCIGITGNESEAGGTFIRYDRISHGQNRSQTVAVHLLTGRFMRVLRIRSKVKGVTMRRSMMIAVALFGMSAIGQSSALAGTCHPDGCSRPRCNFIPAMADTLGLSYFRGPHECRSRFCPPYVYPNRAPRDFWMLR